MKQTEKAFQITAATNVVILGKTGEAEKNIFTQNFTKLLRLFCV